MAKIIPITEHFQHFLAEMKESSGAISMGRRNGRGSDFLSCSRSGSGIGFRGGRYERRRGGGASIATATTKGFRDRFGTIRLRIARTRDKSFLPVGCGDFSGGRKKFRC